MGRYNVWLQINCILILMRLFYTEQIEKRRAEVNEEMADIVHRFEAAAEAFPIAAESQNDTAPNESMNQSHMDRSEDDSYYRCDFKSSVVKSNDRSDKRGDNSPNADDDENDASSNDDANNKHYTKTKNGNYSAYIQRIL